ncbi:hypothetical protein LINPERPRIM_LOCUS22111 [Linum perenne]
MQREIAKVHEKLDQDRGHSFKGSTCQATNVIYVISLVMDAALTLLAGRYHLHRP